MMMMAVNGDENEDMMMMASMMNQYDKMVK